MRRRATLAFVAGAAVLTTATAGMLAGIEPFPTWYYLFAWVPTLLMLDAAVAWRGGRFFLLGRPAFLASLMAWSIPFWLLFELFNFRLENWYYVFVPAGRAARWAGITLAFATVLPAIFGAERLLEAWGMAGDSEPGSSRSLLRVTERTRFALQALGAVMLLLPLVWPRIFFPLVWGGVTLIADPFVHRRDPARSLLGDLDRGHAGRFLRLLAGGMAIGLLWELFNMGARGKWIYTVPGLEDLRLFEMPLLGFFGFPVFALEGFAVYQALVVSGLAARPPVSPHDPLPTRSPGGFVRAPRGARLAALVGAAVFAALVLAGMERGTISSTVPRLADLPDVPASALARSGYDTFALAGARPAEVAAAAGTHPRAAERWIEAARLATLRGIGAVNASRLRASGIRTVRELAGSDPVTLARRLRAGAGGDRVARVRVWIDAAREASSSR
ncbi:MAG: DUF4332 domain-containing protein [Gemmatimonadetes bacterium]|nr:DUF4332 domain-containing protein [Gemmatimonadota bacterium]